MSLLAFDIERLYANTFGSNPYKVGKESAPSPNAPYQLNGTNDVELYAADGSQIQTSLHGVEIWLPTRFRGLPSDLFTDTTLMLPYCVIRITGSSIIVRTPLAERRGSVKELYSIDDYKIILKGFFIDQQRIFPHDDLAALKKLHEMGASFFLDNAVSNAFLNAGTDKVVITGFDLPEVEGGKKHVRPFVMQLESDSVFTLEWKG